MFKKTYILWDKKREKKETHSLSSRVRLSSITLDTIFSATTQHLTDIPKKEKTHTARRTRELIACEGGRFYYRIARIFICINIAIDLLFVSGPPLYILLFYSLLLSSTVQWFVYYYWANCRFNNTINLPRVFLFFIFVSLLFTCAKENNKQ